MNLGESQRPMEQGENMVANMAKHDHNQLPLSAVSMHSVRTSIKDNERMNTSCKGCMLVAVLEVK